jgi:very-short-patch-repair endonuclease
MTKSQLEVMIVEICEDEGITLPEMNAYVAGWKVDAYWPEARFAVELDGYGNHHTPAQLRRDRQKEMALRTAGITPVRYSGDQLKGQRSEVAQELRLATRRGPASGSS